MTQDEKLTRAYQLYYRDLAAVEEARHKLTCPHCGCNLKTERAMFTYDKLYTGHSCGGSEREKQTILKIVSILEEIASNPDDYNFYKTAAEIFQRIKRRRY